MAIICLQYKACSIGYFLDEMKMYELHVIMDNLDYSVRNEWEMVRTLSLAEYQCHSKKRLKPTDVLKFPWELTKHEKPIKEPEELLSKEAVEKMFKDADERKKLLFGDNGE